jgi:quinoprotein glucose dehydrogenase
MEAAKNHEGMCYEQACGRCRRWPKTANTARRRMFATIAAGLFCLADNCVESGNNWPVVGGEPGSSRYSTLIQINRGNVTNLTVAWTYHTGDAGNGSTIECTPIVIDGAMFVTTARCRVVALDAENGCERWRFDPYENVRITQPRASGGVNRGVAYWSDGKQARVLVGAPDGRLISLDAKTGQPDRAFGKGGTVDLREGMEADLDGLNYGPTSAPAVYRDTVVLGFSCPEGGRPAPGDPRAFDVRTGRELWRFHTIPRPGEFGHETWESDGWQHAGAANNWSGTTIDTKNGLVFMATGSASPDFYGGGRRGDNLFANCVLCLDAHTGKRLWHFQTLRHDLWDHDLPAVPNLVTVTQRGRKVDAVAQVTKTGYVYLFERRTGRPLFPIEERPVPASDIPGEQTPATQPIPVKPLPFSRQFIAETDLTDISPEAQAEVLERFRTYRAEAAFAPPSLRGTIVAPGLHAGATWSGASFDPTTGVLYVNSNDQPNVITLVERAAGSPERYVATGYFQFLDGSGHPAIKPPWGLLNAIDLNKGEFLWRVPLGEYPELTARGIKQTGTENFGGTIVTAGGLVFIGGSKDEMFHAFDKASGELLWQYKLGAGGYATPCTYTVKGRQYVAIAAGGGGKLGTRSGDAFVAFALPAKGREPTDSADKTVATRK